jgi:hypothetical protein
MAAKDRKDRKDRQNGKTFGSPKASVRESVQGLLFFAVCAFFRG